MQHSILLQAKPQALLANALSEISQVKHQGQFPLMWKFEIRHTGLRRFE